MTKIEIAMTKTLNAYEDLINDYGGNVHKWNHYADLNHCYLCKAISLNSKIIPMPPYCKENGCPLHDLKKTILWHPCATDNLMILKDSINKEDKNIIIEAAKARYNEILSHIRKNGWVYE